MSTMRCNAGDPLRKAAGRIVLLVACLLWTSAALAQVLESWNEGPAKAAIIRFVTEVTRQGASTYVEPSERIAVFDNDGTLWSEQPLYFQLLFALDQVRLLAPQHPEWQAREPFKSILAGDVKSALAGGERAMAELMAATHAGMSTDEFEARVHEWIGRARHPRFDRPYTELVYQPMLELLAYLRDNGFKTFIVSGGGVDFMRPWTQEVYGIPPEQVIGSHGKLRFETRDGKPVLVKLPQVELLDDRAGKPVGIHWHIGRRPLAAFGNSDGDLEMLQWTTAAPGPRFALIVRHTDAEREWAYEREGPVGMLDLALDEARAKGWTIVDMKTDWKKVYAFR